MRPLLSEAVGWSREGEQELPIVREAAHRDGKYDVMKKLQLAARRLPRLLVNHEKVPPGWVMPGERVQSTDRRKCHPQ